MDVPMEKGDVAFRCNLVSIGDGRMLSYSCGYIDSGEAAQLIRTLDKATGNQDVHFYAGVSYRHLCKIQGHEETLLAECTPPHDIPNQPVAEFLPRGTGSEVLRDLMFRSQAVFHDHPVNVARRRRGEPPATMIWLFWGSGKAEDMPAFHTLHGLRAALSSGVDLLGGLAKMAWIDVLDISGVTDDLGNDYRAQAEGSLMALDRYDLVVIHIEAPDEAAHAGSIDDKVQAIEQIDEKVVGRIRTLGDQGLRVLIMPDHPTPIQLQTHVGEPVPFLLWGPGFVPNGARRLTEREAQATGVFLEEGYNIMNLLTK
jgi:2,3-bisphosphoglycerate-independent phosphoglycerate mutase